MIRIPISNIIALLQGKLSHTEIAQQQIESFSTDTRILKQNSCFIALKGEKYDAHDFLEQAYQNGAIVCIVERIPENYNKPCIVVSSTQKALEQLAVYYSSFFHYTMIGITGSVGKTTTKYLLEQILRQRFSVLCSPKSFNNNIGIPLTLFQLQEEHEIVVMEMGTNHPGEILELTNMVHPNIGVVTCIAPSHCEGFGTLENIAHEKGDILKGMFLNSTFIYNKDDKFCCLIAEQFAGKKVGFSIHDVENCHFDAFHIEFTLDNQSFFVPISGIHNLSNLLASIAIAKELGMTIEEIKKYTNNIHLPEHRLDKKLIHGITLINDAYNANPKSMQAALEYLQIYPAKRRIAVLGSMLELGEKEIDYHKQMGQYLENIDILICIGELSWNIANQASALYPKLQQFKLHQWEEAIPILEKDLQKEDVILFKASHRIQLDCLCDKICSFIQS